MEGAITHGWAPLHMVTSTVISSSRHRDAQHQYNGLSATYIAHRNKITVITSQIFSIFPMAHPFKAREIIMVTSVIYYLRSQSGSKRVPPPPPPPTLLGYT